MMTPDTIIRDVPCGRCGRHHDEHPGGFCPDQVGPDGNVDAATAESFVTPATRYAVVRSKDTQWDSADVIANYLPGNYRVYGEVIEADHAWSCVATGGWITTGETRWVVIAGTDHAGWTLDDYVIPRLGSGVLVATEVEPDDPRVTACSRGPVWAGGA